MLTNHGRYHKTGYGENERTISTTLMTISTMVAQVVALGLTPFMVPNYENIPQMNITWFVVATLGLTICLLKVNMEYGKH